MRLFPRLILVVIMLTAVYWFFEFIKEMQSTAGENGDPHLMSYWAAFMGLAVVTAVVTAVVMLPLLGEFAGSFIFTPNQKIERSPHADALSKLATGDFQGAIDEYKSVFEDNPEDTHAASEIVRLYCEKLNEPEPASDFLVEALSYPDRTPEQTAFLSQRQVDVCWNYQHDGIRARAILIKIAEDMPETREAANAMHRLQEIERAINEQAYLSEQAPVAQEGSVPATEKTDVV